MAANYDDVLAQLRGAGLMVDSLETGRMVRCRVEGGDRERRGWYMLHELVTGSGETLLVGSFGVWHGTQHNPQKVELRKSEISAEQRLALRARLAEDRKRAERERAADAQRAAEEAAKLWPRLDVSGDSEYLVKKGVGAHGVRFSRKGALVIPVLDVHSRIHGLQVIRSAEEAKRRRRPAKEFWPSGMAKKGHFHLIGMPIDVLLVAEGYATGATLHEATQLPVAIAFDAGNLTPVAEALKRRYPRLRILICADDDSFSAGNPGVTAASAAALAVEGSFVKPAWSSESQAEREAAAARGVKLSDFNDLHALEGLHVVRAQIEAHLTALRWTPRQPATAPISSAGGAGRSALKPLQQLDELLSRYALVYGHGGTVFDRQEHRLLSVSDMRDACASRQLHRAWAEHPDRVIVRVDEVGFDPAETDPQITCNLWAGWPTSPRAGCCERLLELLWAMTAEETKDRSKLYEWVLRWLAYPLQHPGAKMKTALVVHGPQGVGKNLFFETYMAIFGPYGRVIDQAAIEDKFNESFSRKLFLIADEVVARSELFHIKNKLKSLITNDWIRINPKNLAAYDERNHVNLVFLSNEAVPVVLEPDDRRHAVIWTPRELEPEFYAEVRLEIADGGSAALHHFLLNLDLGDFHPGTRPPFTSAKAELIDQSLDSTSRFYLALEAGDIDGMPFGPALSEDLYDVYRVWCNRIGSRPAPLPRLINTWSRRHQAVSARKRYLIAGVQKGPHGVVIPRGCSPPDGRTEIAWLSDCIESFRTASAAYKGGQFGREIP